MTILLGYEPWTLTDGRSSWTKTDAGASSITGGATPHANWTGDGDKVLEMVCPADAAAYYTTAVSSPTTFYRRLRIMLTQDGLGTASDLVYCAAAYQGATPLIVVAFFNNAGTKTLLHGFNDDAGGINFSVAVTSPSVGTIYDTELFWSSATDQYQSWNNGSSVVSGSLTGAAAGWNPDTLVTGGLSVNITTQTTVQIDREGVGNEKRLTKAPFMLSGMGRRFGRSRILV